MNMNPSTISKILRTGESEKIEFKETFTREALETLSAFANTKGGTLFANAIHHTTHHGTHHTPYDVDTLTDTEKKIFEFCLTPRTRDEIIQMLGLGPQYVRKKLLTRLVKEQKLEYTLPNTPRSKKQKYMTVKTR
ncbi:MAG: ATP-binding protein [Deltaproteobacteria bacterium]|nr:ATP-binding protein [Deltaproteobacteria bacterium]